MREYPVKKTVKISNSAISEILKSYNMDFEEKEGHIISSYPGLKKIELWTDGKKLYAETETDMEYKNPGETIKFFNNLLEKLTGYTSKERKKLISK
ncbi:MAG: DUF5611 family protein [Ferroplasma sp.]|jgi:hypothetical protein|uniref:DUF5611 family protein n=1 Tax=Ferroplasma sp. TaxID=2591003 RepID=UPI0028157B3F|nr:DUF5611 family protein [Ferroplasma sp.]WMT51401.1 MAG: DUF5611 family protein [Ferroplasma sp.]